MSITAILLDVLVVLVAAKLAAEIAERLSIPPVVGEIVAGLVIGPSTLGLVGTTQVLEVLGELGVILLLLQVGLEMEMSELAAVGRASLSVAGIGVAVPMLAGFGVGLAFGHDANTALFLGAALSATSVGITARVFSDLRALTSIEARTVLGAAVADDVLGLVILTIIVRVVTQGTVSLASISVIIAVALAFLVLGALVGTKIAPVVFGAVQRYSRSPGTLVALALAFTLAFAEIANAAKLAPIVGAFVAGLALSRSAQRDRIERELTPIGHLLIPVFFLQIGIAADVASFARPAVLGLAAALFAVAVLGKIVAFTGAVGSPGDKWLIGLGMIPRGEVGLIFATLGLKQAVLSENLYGSLLLVVLATTLITPPLLRWRLLAVRARPHRMVGTGTPMPHGGWLRTQDGIVDLTGIPAEPLALTIGLRAALAIGHGLKPGQALLDWLNGVGDQPLRWDDGATALLFELLDQGNSRSWRFLEITGLLERALPELAEPLRGRRVDPFLVDPVQVLSFPVLDALEPQELDERAAVHWRQLKHPQWLRLAAVILDTLADDESRVAVARRLVQRLDLGAAAEEHLASLVGNSGLMRATARRLDGFDEESVLKLAVHLGDLERARALYLLELASAPIEPVERSQLDELLGLVLGALEQPELTGLDARNLVERRRAEAGRLANGDAAVVERITHAPRAYLISVDAEAIARQAHLLEPLPRPDHVRVAVTETDPCTWTVEIAARDRPGLLATVVGVLTDAGLDIMDAIVATWPDTGAIESFRGTAAQLNRPLAPRELAAAIETAFRDWPVSSPAPDADVQFDDAGSPWYTICEVRAPNHRGLLRAITVGIANAGAVVHSARAHTTEGGAVDVFEITDRNGRKLDERLKIATRESILTGTASRRPPFLKWIRRFV